jgi:hypothetical protein
VNPGIPRHRRIVVLTFAVGAFACSDPVPITSPEVGQSPTVSPNVWAIRGTVFEHTASGMRTLGGARLEVQRSRGLTTEINTVTSRADGSYDAGAADRESFFVFVRMAPDSPYLTPCPPFTWTEQRLDVHVISAEILATIGIPPSFPTNPTRNLHAPISGRVFERTADGSQAVAAASIALHGGGETRSNSSGHYLLCSVGNSEIAVIVTARKDGYASASAQGVPWIGWDLDFELTRR